MCIRDSLEEAKQLMADAGYPNGEGFPVIEYSANDAGYHIPVAEYAQQAWGELGITVNINKVEWASFLPVSYTHLEVYKRQAVWCCWDGCARQLWMKEMKHNEFWQNDPAVLAARGGAGAGAALPLSLIHILYLPCLHRAEPAAVAGACAGVA